MRARSCGCGPSSRSAKLPDAAERGTLIHDILERFVARAAGAGRSTPRRETRLLAIGREAFDAHADFPEVIALWWPRFERSRAGSCATEARADDVCGSAMSRAAGAHAR